MIFILWYFVCLMIYKRFEKKKFSTGRCILILGKKGKGKSSRAVEIAVKDYIKKGRKVYSTWTLPIAGSSVLYSDFYNYQFPPESLLIIDEGQFDFDSREFKKTEKRLREFLAMIRHYRLNIIVITQYSDGIEKLFRCAADEIWDLRQLINLPGGKISFYKRYEDIIQYSKYLDGKETSKSKIGIHFYPNSVFDFYDSYIIDPAYIKAQIHPIHNFNVQRSNLLYLTKLYIEDKQRESLYSRLFNEVVQRYTRDFGRQSKSQHIKYGS